jgi:hypothetical protein
VCLQPYRFRHPNFFRTEFPDLPANPFIDPAGYKAYVDRMEAAFNTRLEEQKKAAK